jgi:hypothetical protein
MDTEELVAPPEPLTPVEKHNVTVTLREVESALNEALLAVPVGKQPELRRALLDARGNIREAIGEART